MTRAEVERFLVAIKTIADAEAERAELQAKGAVGQAFAAGIVNLRDELLAELDVGEFAAIEEHDTTREQLVETMKAFCFRWCSYSREEEPGSHKFCERCPMAQHTIQPLRDGIAAATEGGTDERDD